MDIITNKQKDFKRSVFVPVNPGIERGKIVEEIPSDDGKQNYAFFKFK